MNEPRHTQTDLRQPVIDCINTGRYDQARLLCLKLCQDNDKDAESWFLLAGINAQLGDLTEVARCCRKVIVIQPNNTAARYNLGVALQMQGKHAEAEKIYRSILQIDPGNVSTLINLGISLRSAGRTDEAIAIFRETVRIKPDSTDAINNLGLCLRDQRDFAGALECFKTALSLQPSSAQTLCNLGLCLLDQASVDDAIDAFRKALQYAPDLHDAVIGLTAALIHAGEYGSAVEALERAISRHPDNPELHFALGNAYSALGNRTAAAASYRSAIKLHPHHYKARNNLASLLQECGRFQEAESNYRAALQSSPNEASILYNLSTLLLESDRIIEALDVCHQALQARPDEPIFRQHFIKLLGSHPPDQLPNEYTKDILRCFSWTGVDFQYLSAPTLALLRKNKHYRKLEALSRDADSNDIVKTLRDRAFSPLLRDPYLHALLIHTVICDTDAEKALTAIRKGFLLMLAEQRHIPTDTEVDFMAALACQCTNNEFSYLLEPQESDAVGGLARTMDDALGDSPDSVAALQGRIAVLSMYKPLHELAHKDALTPIIIDTLRPNVRVLIERQLLNWEAEQALRAQIPHLTGIDDGISRLVRDQYEENPYPRWLGVNLQEPRHYSQVFRSLFPHFEPPDFQEKTLNVLIAGCGTGKHAILSKTRFADSDHLAVDLSTASLAYAQRKTLEYRLSGLRFMQADILELAGMEQRFHVIESVGVLHHMADPGAGLEVLTGLLRPGGLMNIGLYSARARRDISAVRQHYGNLIAAPNKDIIRRVRREIIDMPADSPIRRITRMNDFYSLSDCRDLLFHVQEHCFTLPQIQALLEKHKLNFIGFEFPNPKAKSLYRTESPDDPALTDLEHWDRFEQRHPDTFEGMYVFWCQKQ